jgi:hypothetical protein
MDLSTVINRLQHLKKVHGNMNVYMDTNPDKLLSIGEIDVDADDTGVIFWPKEPEA